MNVYFAGQATGFILPVNVGLTFWQADIAATPSLEGGPVYERSMSTNSTPWHGNALLQLRVTATVEREVPLMFLKWMSESFTFDPCNINQKYILLLTCMQRPKPVGSRILLHFGFNWNWVMLARGLNAFNKWYLKQLVMWQYTNC